MASSRSFGLRSYLYIPNGTCFGRMGSRERYDRTAVLGRGTFGEVYRATRRSDGCSVAIKRIQVTDKDVSGSRGGAMVAAEIQAMRELGRLNNPYIITMCDFWHVQGTPDCYIVMEYATHGDLHSEIQRIKKSGQGFSGEALRSILYQLLSALDACHSYREPSTGETHPIIHSDIKPQNILMTQAEGAYKIKLSDFGLNVSEALGAGGAPIKGGTACYLAPELLVSSRATLSNGCTPATDMWAVGAVLFELCWLRSLIDPNLDADRLRQDVMAVYEPRLPAKLYSLHLQHALERLLQQNPISRPSATALLHEPYFDGLESGTTSRPCRKNERLRASDESVDTRAGKRARRHLYEPRLAPVLHDHQLKAECVQRDMDVREAIARMSKESYARQQQFETESAPTGTNSHRRGVHPTPTALRDDLLQRTTEEFCRQNEEWQKAFDKNWIEQNEFAREIAQAGGRFWAIARRHENDMDIDGIAPL